jgi:hypothetical protein
MREALWSAAACLPRRSLGEDGTPLLKALSSQRTPKRFAQRIFERDVSIKYSIFLLFIRG